MNTALNAAQLRVLADAIAQTRASRGEVGGPVAPPAPRWLGAMEYEVADLSAADREDADAVDTLGWAVLALATALGVGAVWWLWSLA